VTLAFALVSALAGCAGVAIEEAVPQAPAAAEQAQITPQEREALKAKLEAARAGQKAPGRTRVELTAEELRAIARGHADEALDSIEAE
jgi:hypothetical protein